MGRSRFHYSIWKTQPKSHFKPDFPPTTFPTSVLSVLNPREINWSMAVCYCKTIAGIKDIKLRRPFPIYLVNYLWPHVKTQSCLILLRTRMCRVWCWIITTLTQQSFIFGGLLMTALSSLCSDLGLGIDLC